MYSNTKLCIYLLMITLVLAQNGRESGGRALRDDKRWQDVGNGVQNHDAANTVSINRMNVNQTSLLWIINLDNVPGQPYPPSVDGTVVYFDGMAYFADSLGAVYSAYGNNGSILWRQNCSTGITRDTIEAFRKTPFVDVARVCVSARNVFCLSRVNGAIIWKQSNSGDTTSVGPDGRLTSYYATSGDITSIDGRLFVSSASTQNSITRDQLVDPNNQDLTARGSVSAFNLETGVVLWRFFTTSDQTQPNPQYGAGGGIYSSPAIDVLSQTLFIGSGQSYEPPASPLTDSLLAIDYVTGKLKWSYQTRAGDIFSQFYPGPDRDVNTHPNVFEVVAQRVGDVIPRIYRVVGVGTKNGDYYLFETIQDNPSSPVILAAVNIEFGSSIGGFQGTPAFSDGILYCATHASVLANGTRVPAQASNFFSLSTKVTAVDVQALIEGRPYIKWQVANPPNFLDFTFGDVVYSEGVVYTASFNGRLRGLNSETGDQVFVRVPQPFAFQGFANNPIHGGPAVVDGKILISFGSAFSGVFVKGGVAAYGYPYARPQVYSSQIIVPPAGQPGCSLGYQRCNEGQQTFQTCVYTNNAGNTDFSAVQQCAPGTSCQSFMQNYIICS